MESGFAGTVKMMFLPMMSRDINFEVFIYSYFCLNKVKIKGLENIIKTNSF